MNTYWAIRSITGREQEQFENLKKGIANFGWSYKEGCDLNILKNMSQEERKEKWAGHENCYNKAVWLRNINIGDWVAYINIPTFGKVTIAQVVSGYYYEENLDNLVNGGHYAKYEGRHCFKIDPSTIHTFDRNASIVPSPLSRNFKNMGNHWRIKSENDFVELINRLTKGVDQETQAKLDKMGSNKHSFFNNTIKELQKCYPRKELESLLEETFQNIPNVTNVKNNGSGWGTDFGADLIVTYRDGISAINMVEEKTLVVQVASFTGEFETSFKVDQIKTAINKFNADMGLIATTSTSVSSKVIDEINNLSEELNKPISILYGTEFIQFVLSYTFNPID